MVKFPIQGPTPGGGAGTDGHIIEDEGTPLAQQPTINFIGAGVVATDNGGTSATDVTIAGGISVIGTQQFGIGSNGWYPGITNPANAIALREIGVEGQQARYIGFPDGADTIAYLDWFVPQNINITGDIKMKFYWTTEFPSATTETIEMLISGVERGDSDAIGAQAFGAGVIVNDTWLANDDTHITAQSGAINIGGTLAKDSWVQFKLLRDISADDLAGEMQLLGCVLEYVVDAGVSVG